MGILDRMRLDGKVAYVTVGAQGLGKAMATGLAEAGATLRSLISTVTRRKLLRMRLQRTRAVRPLPLQLM
ncbi:hypothetical protein [Secundilactobacillus paracollinoides]|uniref:hypothetical protein n=1 Tax=Secundilactobacillus paracollinoides TaxID=240427 RepID=UPI000A7D2D40|nr:hypothetical protein [Secundilactobacillus paracollinoides]